MELGTDLCWKLLEFDGWILEKSGATKGLFFIGVLCIFSA
jgi:hypothetical protein